jgi:uncharacterized protein YkwD
MRSLPFRFVVAALALSLLLFAAGTAEAGRYRFTAPATCATGNCPSAVQYQVPQYTAPVQAATPQTPVGTFAGYTADGRALYTPVYRVATAAVSATANPLGWVNHYRAMHGLRALAYDANLSAAASQNNAACSSRGLGHFVMAGCAQDAAGTSDPAYAAQLWYQSPAHRATMLSPTATTAGIAHSYGYATLNVR